MAALSHCVLVVAVFAVTAHASSSSSCSEESAACVHETPTDAALGLLQHQSAAHRVQSHGQSAAAASASSKSPHQGPIMMPMQAGLEPFTAETWPMQVNKDPMSLTTEKVCMQAFQTAYDCQFIPQEFGGATCTCLDDVAITWNCPTWYSTMLWGTWYMKPTNTKSVPMGFDKVNETKAVCMKAFQQAFDCTDIDMYEGGAKGSCYAGYCQRWWNACLSEGDFTKDVLHKDSVLPEVRELVNKASH
mmetsp:Transcript_32541/g.93704  ORF Transcript_32541/g.93704 Transcript_32541/m.93704 type:complete len:246 (-) Transcript_32541:49-786(-)